MKKIILLGIALIVRLAISARRINSERKKVFFKSFKIVLENNSLREEHILVTLFTNTICDRHKLSSTDTDTDYL